MPLLEVEVVLRPAEKLPADLAARLAECAGSVFGSAPGETWVKLWPLPADQYAENDSQLPEGFYPVFVSILQARQTPLAARQAEVSELTASIAHVCGRPVESVHLVYQPEGQGRVAFGGKLVLP